MICPHCAIRFKIQNQQIYVFVPDPLLYDRQIGYEVKGYFCPECNDLILHLSKGGCDYNDNRNSSGYYMEKKHSEIMIFPKTMSSDLGAEVPEKYKKDFLEAAQVLYVSPKASAAISRRLLQEMIHEDYGIKKKDLFKEIEEFINLPGIPAYLSDSVDAVRNIGNLAAHPLKSTQTGHILDVEDGEAEWLLEVLEAMFDFTFVQPTKLKERREKLNAKLKELGKPDMIGSD